MQILNAMSLTLRGYEAPILRTRLNPYLDDISLALDANGTFNLDFSEIWHAANDGAWEVAA